MVATTGTFHNVLQVIQTSGLNYRLELSPFSATIYLKNSSIKDKNGNPLSYSPHRIDSQLARMKSENDELSRKISQQDKIIEILQTNYYSNAAGEQIYQAKENLEVKLHQKPSFPFPPPGFLIPQPGHQLQVPQPHETVQHDDTKHSELSRDYSELENELKLFESCKLALEKDLEMKRKMAEDAEKKSGDLEKDAVALKAQNNLLKENNKVLEADTKKIKSDYLELSKKVASQFSEYQVKIKELSVEKTVIENRKLKKEEKSAKKKAKKEQKAGISEIDSKVEQVEFRCDDREENDGVNFTCTICAKFCDMADLSSKSVPEEHDTCKACNVEDISLGEPTKQQPAAVDETKNVEKSVNVVHYFWNGDSFANHRLAIDYVNMCQYSNHDCDECAYISVINEGVAPGRTGGWSMQFCKKFNFKLGDPLREPPYILGSLPLT